MQEDKNRNMVDAALNFSNRIRKELGLNPVSVLLPGKRGHANSCPISRTIGFGYNGRVTTSLDCYVFNPDGIAVIEESVPANVVDFIIKFDDIDLAAFSELDIEKVL